MVDALLSGWLTPTSLFVLLNIVVATILVSHRTQNQKQNQKHDRENLHNNDTNISTHETVAPPPPPPQVTRVPSLFSRVTSFNFTNYYPPYQQYSTSYDEARAQPEENPSRPELEQEQTQPTPSMVSRAPSFLSRVSSFNIPGLNRAVQPEPAQPVTVTQSPPGEESRAEVKPARDEKEEKKPKAKAKAKVKATAVRQRKVVQVEAKETVSFKREEEEVDTKADDFINRFKQQLKMQRLESLLRHKST